MSVFCRMSWVQCRLEWVVHIWIVSGTGTGPLGLTAQSAFIVYPCPLPLLLLLSRITVPLLFTLHLQREGHGHVDTHKAVDTLYVGG